MVSPVTKEKSCVHLHCSSIAQKSWPTLQTSRNKLAKLMKSANLHKRTSEARRRRKKDSTMLRLPSHPLRGPKRRTKSGSNFPQAVHTPTTHGKPKVSQNDHRGKMTILKQMDTAFTCRKVATVRKPFPTTAASSGRLHVCVLCLVQNQPGRQ